MSQPRSVRPVTGVNSMNFPRFALKRWKTGAAVLLVSAAFVAAVAAPSEGAGKQASTKASSPKSSKSKKAHTSSRKGKHSKKAGWRSGQQKMDADRARQVQQALIREHYLAGEPTGVWDQKSQNAMLRYQSDNGWQPKIVPDSRALIKLGL